VTDRFLFSYLKIEASMQIRVLIAALSAATLMSTAAGAAPAVWGHARLSAPLAAPKTEVVGGVEWKCEANTCVATVDGSHTSWSTMYACKKVAGAFGTLASYETSGLAMTSGNLEVCNKAAAH
jgi:hypothetical protein